MLTIQLGWWILPFAVWLLFWCVFCWDGGIGTDEILLPIAIGWLFMAAARWL